METLLQDLRYALRGLSRSPGFTLAAVLTLGLGIGINAVAFGAIDGLLLRPPPGVGDPDGLFRVQLRLPPRPGAPAEWGGAGVPYPYLVELRDRSGAFSSLAAYAGWRKVTLDGDGSGERRDANYVSSDYFTALRVRPALGHLFTPVDDRAAPYAAVLSYDFWLRHFGGDPGVVGRTLRIDGRPTEVLGVAPPRFRGLDLTPVDVWLTISAAGGENPAAMFSTGTEMLQLVGRPRPGLTPGQAAAHIMAVAPPAFLEQRGVTGLRATLVPARQRYAPGQSPIPPWVLSVTAIVLLVACANVAGLLLARAARRRRELAVRLALGASRGRIARQLLTEALVLAGGGAALGLLLATWGDALLPLLGAPRFELVDARAMAFTGGAMLVALLGAGLAPALRASRTDIEAQLRSSAGRAVGDRSRLRAALTIGQVALALALLVCAGLFARSLRNARAIRIGYDTEHAVVVDALFFSRGSMSPAERAAFYPAAAERLRHLAGVTAVERVSVAPNQGISFTDIAVPGGQKHKTVINTLVGPDYFRAMGTALLEGRAFTVDDRPSSPPVAVVTPAFARKYFPGRDPLGACFVVLPGPACTRIVGVVEDSKVLGVLREAPAQFYLPLAQHPDVEPDVSVVVRTRGDPDRMAAAIRREVQALDRRVDYVVVSPERELLRSEFASWRTATVIVSSAALLTLALALIGLYGVISFLAVARTREVGIRIALGAQPAQIRALVVREGVRLTLAGATLGTALALIAARLLRSHFYGVSPTEPWIYAVAAAALAAAALAASYLPARRAARTDPIEALRSE